MRFSARRCAKVAIVCFLSVLGLFFIFNIDAKLDSTGTQVSRFHRSSGLGSNTTLHRSERSAGSFSDQYNGGTNQHNDSFLRDVMISIKTTGKFHKSRLKILLDTWIKNARNQTYIFTDQDDDWLKSQLPDGHVINTHCPQDHSRKSLCCKMATEFDTFIVLKKKWFCHMDDDTYLNIPKLTALLQKYNHTSDWYLGKPSLQHPIEIVDRQHPGQMLAFWFATGGAGFCISRSLALKMVPHAGGGRLMRVGEQIRLPDDCTVGYIINSILRKDLTVIPEFHSHLEAMWKISPQNLQDQITVSYMLGGDRPNVVRLPEYSEKKDPTRFWSVHCHLNPMTKDCLGDR